MENENDIQETEETSESSEVAEATEGEAVDWKSKAEEAEKRIKELEIKAIKQREKTKELKAKAVTEAESKPSDFTSGDKALLRTYGITELDERTFAKNWIDKYGGDIDDMFKDEVFQSRLKSIKDAKIAKDAVPVSTGRSATAQGNKLDYWLAKYQTSNNLSEVPKELQRDVLNARLKAEEQKKMFG